MSHSRTLEGYVKRTILIDLCEMMVKAEPGGLRIEQHRKTAQLRDKDGKKVASLHGHNGRGGNGDIPMSSALSILRQVAKRNTTLYEMAKVIISEPDFQKSGRASLRI